MLAPKIAPADLSALLAAARETRHAIRDTALAYMLCDVAPRPCELADLTWRALVLADGKLSGRCRWQGAKGSERRDLALSPATLAALQALLDSLTAGGRRALDINAPVFATERNGEPFKAQSMSVHVRRMFARAGLKASAYSVRHSIFTAAARDVIALGGTHRDLMAFTGHKRLESVTGYLEDSPITGAAMVSARIARMADM